MFTEYERKRLDAAITHMKDMKADAGESIIGCANFIKGSEWTVNEIRNWIFENVDNYVRTCYDEGTIDVEGLIDDFNQNFVV